MRAASHWSVIGPGRRGGVGPEARRPPSDHKPEALVERGGSLQLQLRSTGLTAGLLTLALAPTALAGPSNVTVRVEGASSTLVEEGGLATTTTPVNKRGQGECTGTSAAGALERATNGDWDGTYYGADAGYGVERIFSETYTFNARGDYWAFWVNGRAASQGVCKVELQEGDSVLFFVDQCFDAQPPDYACKNDPVRPLELTAPPSAQTGAPVTLSVATLDGNGGSSPTAGARITGGGVDATTGTDGKATVTFSQAGQVALKATKSGSVRSAAEKVAVSAPGQPVAPAAPVARDTAAPVGRVRGIRNGQRFKRKRAPRTLRGSVLPDPSGLQAVKLSLTRSSRGRCQLYSPTRERFRPSRCGRRVNFSIGDRQDWSYLLPERLRAGRYVLDVIAIDKVGNRDRPVRGRNRVVFFVR